MDSKLLLQMGYIVCYLVIWDFIVYISKGHLMEI